MARADRLARADIRRAELETEYSDALVAALRATAGGTWGLFDHQADRMTRQKVAPIVDNLTELAEAIDALRSQLGLGAFALHEEYLASRGKVAPHAVGEPKQAKLWLQRMGLTE